MVFLAHHHLVVSSAIREVGGVDDVVEGVNGEVEEFNVGLGDPGHGCQTAKFDPFLSWDCTRVEGVGAQSKERKGSNIAA